MPQSIALYGREYQRYVLNHDLVPGEFRYRILCEGDSWMDRSSAFTGALPDHLARAMDEVHRSTLLINLAQFGDTMRRIGEVVAGDFSWWLDQMRFDAILLSAGGNDFIDAARDPDPGQGILRDLRGAPPPAQGRDCVQAAAVTSLVDSYLNPNFDRLYQAVRQHPNNAATPIFLNSYDTPVARDAPAPPGRRAWLQAAYVKNGIAPALWPDLTDAVFSQLRQTLEAWPQGRSGVHVVPTNRTLTPADSDAHGDSHDWINEIHPNQSGWRKLAPVWRSALLSVLA